MTTAAERDRRHAEPGAGPAWWIFLVAGIAWTLLALAILQFDVRSIWSIAIVFGIVLIFASVDEFFAASTAPGWRWAHALLGVLFLVGGIIAVAWPGATFVILARIFAWYLLFKGTFDIVTAFALRGLELWWVRLVAGVLELVLAFWAAGYPGRSTTLLILWVGFGALAHGITDIVLAFQIRSARGELTGTSDTGLPPRPTATAASGGPTSAAPTAAQPPT